MTDPVYSSDPPGPTTDADAAAILERVEACVKDVSLGFERWDEPHVRGPGLYFVIERSSTAEFTTTMGTNRWPVERCQSVFAETAALLDAARRVALSCDGAVVVHPDGTFTERMVRFGQLSAAEHRRTGGLPFAGWMGARHMSALETSTREAVLASVTLSEEDGRTTVFTEGTFEDFPAASLLDG